MNFSSFYLFKKIKPNLISKVRSLFYSECFHLRDKVPSGLTKKLLAVQNGKTRGNLLLVKRFFYVTKYENDIKSISVSDDVDLNEQDYWNELKESLEDEQDITRKQITKSKLKDSISEKCVFVLQLKMQYKSKARQSTTPELQLAESISLVNTLSNWRVVDSIITSTKRSGSKEIFGSGNQEMLAKRISSSGANCLFVVIDRLTNLQTSTIRKTLLGNNPNVKIYDRYTIVLEIFKRNARSSIAKLQIALAEIPYIRHKFQNNDLYKNVERKINRELEHKLRTRSLMNKQRQEKSIPTVSVFGYTNAGKTSFIKMITNDSKLKPENKLFATLDITYHGTSLSNSSQDVIFIDTIGLISDIPHNLVESFRTTLIDALNADFLIHLVDISNPDRVAQEKTVNEILTELAPREKLQNLITIYNKCDKINKQPETIPESQINEVVDSLPSSKEKTNLFYVSCKTGHGMAQVKDFLEKSIYKKMGFMELNLKIRQGSAEMAYLYKNSIVKELKDNDDPQFVTMNVLINKVNAFKFINSFPNVQVSAVSKNRSS